MPRTTLASIRAAADRKYGPYELQLSDGSVVSLLNPLRLDDEKYEVLIAAENPDDKRKPREMFEEIIRTVARSASDAEALIAEAAGDVPTLAELVKDYGKSAQPGEAEPSAS